MGHCLLALGVLLAEGLHIGIHAGPEKQIPQLVQGIVGPDVAIE